MFYKKVCSYKNFMLNKKLCTAIKIYPNSLILKKYIFENIFLYLVLLEHVLFEKDKFKTVTHTSGSRFSNVHNITPHSYNTLHSSLPRSGIGSSTGGCAACSAALPLQSEANTARLYYLRSSLYSWSELNYSNQSPIVTTIGHSAGAFARFGSG